MGLVDIHKTTAVEQRRVAICADVTATDGRVCPSRTEQINLSRITRIHPSRIAQVRLSRTTRVRPSKTLTANSRPFLGSHPADLGSTNSTSNNGKNGGCLTAASNRHQKTNDINNESKTGSRLVDVRLNPVSGDRK